MQIFLNRKHELVDSAKEKGFSVTGKFPIKYNSSLLTVLNSMLSDFTGMICVLKYLGLL